MYHYHLFMLKEFLRKNKYSCKKCGYTCEPGKVMSLVYSLSFVPGYIVVFFLVNVNFFVRVSIFIVALPITFTILFYMCGLAININALHNRKHNSYGNDVKKQVDSEQESDISRK